MKLRDLVPKTDHVTPEEIDLLKRKLTECWDVADALLAKNASQEEWDKEYSEEYEDFDEMFFMGSNWVKTPDAPKDSPVSGHVYAGQHICVMCSDTFYYACADCEHVPDDELLHLLRGIVQFGYEAVKAYVSKKRGGIDPLPMYPLDREAVDFFKNLPIKAS